MDVKEALIKVLEDAGLKNIWSVKGKVVSVDTDKRTCEVEPNNGEANYTDVKLQSSESLDTGVVFIPKKDSDVIVHFLAEDEAFVSKTSEVTKIELITEDGSILLNGDDFGGLIQIENLTSKINTLVSDFNKFVDKYNSHTHVTTATIMATPTVGTIAPTTKTATKTEKFNKSDFENETVKHG